MDQKPQSADWRSILLIIFGLSGALLAFTSAMGILLFIFFNEAFFTAADVPPLATILTASTMVTIGLLLLPVAWLSLQRVRGREFNSFSLPPLRAWAWIVFPVLWLLVIVLASLFYDVPGANWFAPLLHFLSIALPIYIVIRVGVNRIPLGSSQRAWGVFGIGMTISPFLAIILEIFFIVLGILVVALFLGFNPEIMADIENLVNRIQSAPDMDSMLQVAGPVIKNPLTLLTGLAFLSFLVPVMEETAKSIGVWLVADRLTSPAQGFALGVLSGAGFALAESLSASLTADEGWGFTLAVRAISGSMHMLATGLFGWGIAYARLEKRYFRLFGMVLLAILLHSAWNAGAVFVVLGGARVMLSMPGFDFLGVSMALGGAGLLFIMMGSMIVAFFVLNWRLGTPDQSDPFPVAEQGLPPSDKPDEMGGVK